MPAAGALLTAWLADGDWRKRHASLICLAQIAEGCTKVMLQQIEPLVDMCIKGLQDVHPKVCVCVFARIQPGQARRDGMGVWWGVLEESSCRVGFGGGYFQWQCFAAAWCVTTQSTCLHRFLPNSMRLFGSPFSC